ncbi:hypothetical protein KRP22_007845 [Phytophthora ramorum]|nr:hypothetical protein KRP22_4143 [Phytophthora ramorum]
MTHAQKYRLKAARRLREAQRKQAAARHGLHNAHRGGLDSPLMRRSLQTPTSGGLGLGACSKMRLPCSCSEKDCVHMEDASKIYIAWLDAGKFDPVIKMQAFGSDDLVPLDSAASDLDEFPTLEDCASELLELLF